LERRTNFSLIIKLSLLTVHLLKYNGINLQGETKESIFTFKYIAYTLCGMAKDGTGVEDMVIFRARFY
jgi:hypothetical protein